MLQQMGGGWVGAKFNLLVGDIEIFGSFTIREANQRHEILIMRARVGFCQTNSRGTRIIILSRAYTPQLSHDTPQLKTSSKSLKEN